MNILNHKGQALLEFILFIPLMLVLLSLFMTVSSAINASINQQKITRGYFFHIVQNDSNIPNQFILDSIRGDGASVASLFSIGWQESSSGKSPVAPCFRIKTFFGNNTDEKCSPGELSGTTTQFIRVKTAFGICGNTYLVSGQNYVFANHATSSNPGLSATPTGCMNQ